MTQLLITGGQGQLGSVFIHLKSEFSTIKFFTPGREELDISDYNSIQNFILDKKIDGIVNCAGYTDVNKAEIEFELANKINHKAVVNLVKIVKKYNLKFVQISTDYVFDGNSKKPYNEKSNVNPINKYGISKCLGEAIILKENPKNTIIIRTSWIYSDYKLNFVKKILEIGHSKKEIFVVSDEIGSPTNAYDLIKAILLIIPLIKNNTTEIYHYANKGKCSRLRFAQEIIKLSNSECKVRPILTFDFDSKVKRPKYSVLCTSKIEKDFGLIIPKWNISLKKFIKNRIINL